jgi:hypothetical protein
MKRNAPAAAYVIFSALIVPFLTSKTRKYPELMRLYARAVAPV